MSIDLVLSGLKRDQKIVSIAKLNPIFSREKDLISQVVEKILETGYRRLAILSPKGKVSGVITTMDILDAFLRKQSFNEPVSTIMSREVITCNANDTVYFLLQKFKISRRGGFPVLDNGKLIGMVSERDIVKRFASVPFNMSVSEVMTKRPFFIKSSLSIFDTAKALVNTRYRRLPIVEENKLVGLITTIDLLKQIQKYNFDSSKLHTPVEDISIKQIYTVMKNQDVSDAIGTMVENDVGGLPVIDSNNMLEGMITERDILEEIV
jgi:CBS domain-containing protein